MTNVSESVLITNKIQFHGQAPATGINYRADPLDVCPNEMDPSNGAVTSQPYQFQFESNCAGNSGSTSCRYRPNFLWTVKYFTENGNYYEEKWQDQTSGNFSIARFYLYDRVPFSNTPNSGQASQAGGNSQFSRFPLPNYAACMFPPAITAMPGERITEMRLECTGYSCGWGGGDDSDAITIRYYNRRPGAITVAGNPPEYCRDQAYTLDWGAPFDAGSYNVTANNGAQVSGVSGTSATLSFANVPRTTTSITVTVTSANTNAPCSTSLSEPRTFTLPVRRAPAQPANLQIDGACPSTAFKTLTIDPVSLPPGQTGQSVSYRWYISGSNTAGANLVNNAGQFVQDTGFGHTRVLQLVTPNMGDVTINVEAQVSDCGGPGPAVSKIFQIGDINPVCPAASFYYGYCGAPNTLVFSGQPGLSYFIARQPYNISVPGGTATVGNGTSATSTNRPITVDFSRGSFDIDVIVTSPCAPAGSSGFINCTLNVYVPKFLFVPCRSASDSTKPAVVRLYPNPSTGRVAVQSDRPTRYKWVRVLNLQGRVVLEQSATAPEGVNTFDVQTLPMGLYQVQLFDGKKLITQRLQKE